MKILQVRGKLVDFMQRIHANSSGREVDFDCMPENVDSLDPNSSASEFYGGTSQTPLLSCYSQRRAADCRYATCL
jgi:hypothetical protein